MEEKYELPNRILYYQYAEGEYTILERIGKKEVEKILKNGLSYKDKDYLIDVGLVILYHVCSRIETGDKDDSIRVFNWN